MASKSYTGYFGTLFMGLTLGLVAAPCIGPFVLGLLTWVASMGSPWLGFLIFFTLSMGLGLPLFLLAIFSGNWKSFPVPASGCSGCANSWAGCWSAWPPILSGPFYRKAGEYFLWRQWPFSPVFILGG